MPPAEHETSHTGEDEYASAPWHFKLLLAAFVLYLAYRLVQLVIWTVGRVS